MKILALSNLYPPDVIGGYEVACGQVVDGLRANGHDVRVLTSVPRQPAPRVPHVLRRLRLADEWNDNVLGKFPVVALTVHAHSRFIDAHNVFVLGQTLDAFRPDVVYVCNLIGVGGLGLAATLMQRGVPWVWQLGDCTPVRLCHGRKVMYPTLAEEFNRRIRGAYIIVSEGVRRETERFGIRLQGRVELLPNWITGKRPAPRRAYREGGRLRIMSAGSVNRDKGIDILIEAAAELRLKGFDDFGVDVFGKIGDASLGEMVRELGLESHVTLRGPRPHADLMDLYKDYDIFAFPTQEREPFGMAALEAASRGCVPVITRTCGIGEWLVHGVHCLKAERSAESFATVLHQAATNAVALEPIARRAEAACWRDFHLDAILPRIEDVLRDAAREPRKATHGPAEVDKMARMAEQLAESLVQEAASA